MRDAEKKWCNVNMFKRKNNQTHNKHIPTSIKCPKRMKSRKCSEMQCEAK